jgi:hypothetical protein
MKAANIKTGMVFWDNSEITVLSETKCFITVLLANGDGMKDRGLERKWKKTSEIILKAA